MHTEEEARKLWCPFARSLPMRESASGDDFETLPPHNRTIDEGGKYFMDTARCIASECAAWRWVYGEPFLGADQLGRAGTVMERHKTEKGYCGLAGRPS